MSIRLLSRVLLTLVFVAGSLPFRLNCISEILELIPYEKISRPKVKLPKRSTKGEYDDRASLQRRNFVAEKF